MSLRFVYGPSGSGKSTYVQKYVIDKSMSDPARKHLLIVPDQFTMQAQVRMIELHPDHAFSNIEVLSFSRLSHRILEEIGGEDVPVLDDTGKNLIIRRVAGEVADSLVYVGGKLDRYGFVSEIKSAISEFMQYGYRPADVRSLAERASERRLLSMKLSDIAVIYEAFMKYKADRFLTREETLDIVAKGLHKSELVKGATLVLDGFTGFTPIQEQVIRELMVLSREVIFTFTLPADADPCTARSEEDMFWLCSRAARRIRALADDAGVITEEHVPCQRKADGGSMLDHLERHAFRYPTVPYAGSDRDSVRIYRAQTISDEIRDTFGRIRSLTAGGKLRYRDVALVVGNMASYADEVMHAANEAGIPIYMDYSRSIMTTPIVEALLSAMDVVRTDYARESVIRHMRTGFGPLDRDETDVLENFLLRTGIRGRASYERVWTIRRDERSEKARTPEGEEWYVTECDRINSIRERVLAHFESLRNISSTYPRALYEFMVNAGMHDRLLVMSTKYGEIGDSSSEKQYAQIYDKIMELLDQMEALCGEDVSDADEFAGILEAGLSELKVGVIPQESDQVLVGDMIRTRLSHVKALFLLGVNDSNIPGTVSSGGLISDVDRDFLTGMEDVCLAPTPREQMFTQRLYLYMNMTKPACSLTLSYVTGDAEGNDMMPSYLIGLMRRLFPELAIENSGSTHSLGGHVLPANRSDVSHACAAMIRDYVDGRIEGEDVRLLAALCRTLMESGLEESCRRMFEMSMMRHVSLSLPAQLVRDVYGEVIRASVSRLEKFAGCAYAHFLSYGLKLVPRPEFTFENRDMGEVYHKALEEFGLRMRTEGLSWEGLTDEDADEWVREITERITSVYGDTILVSSKRNKALSGRIRRVIRRSVDTIRYQVTQGSFVPAYFEKQFETDRRALLPGGNEAPYKLMGKIDRVDVSSGDGAEYVRIIDYKSGNRVFDLSGLYHGFKLQLAIYMHEALRLGNGVRPAGMLYFHVSDPMVKAAGDMTDVEAADAVRYEMRMKGIIAADEDVYARMDRNLAPGIESHVVPVKLTMDGVPDGRTSKTYDPEIFDVILKYAGHKSDELIGRLLEGDIDCAPATYAGAGDPCRFCDYSASCRIKSGLDGYKITRYDKESDEALLERMIAELGNKDG